MAEELKKKNEEQLNEEQLDEVNGGLGEHHINLDNPIEVFKPL